MEKLTGVVERVTFHSEETGWSVLKISSYDSPGRLLSVTVHQAEVFAGASMEFHGHWTTHDKYGDQFKAESAIEKKPASTAALEKYLGSGLIKGVGPKTAKKIVKHFGARTLEVFESHIDELMKVPTIAEKKLVSISESWESHKSIRDVMIFLQSHGVSTLFAVKIFKVYGNQSIQRVSENPYTLAKDIYGIGFFSADKIALTLGFRKDGAKRISAGIRHVLSASRDEGHCYLTQQQVVENTHSLLDIQEEALILDNLNSLLEEGEIKKQILKDFNNPDITSEAFYSKSLFFDELSVAKIIRNLLKIRYEIQEEKIQSWILKYCKTKKIQLSPEQLSSVLGVVQKSFSILTGGPGCGKTTTTRVLVQLLLTMKKKVLLAAPTGRAAQRMSEVIGVEAKTIHRLLEWDPREGRFKKDEEDPLFVDFLVIDECSMLDIHLTASLLKALPQNAQILFIGDPDQLPSVGPGAVLQDLLQLDVVPNFRLTKIFRQAELSQVVQYAHEMNSGKTPRIKSPLADPTLWKKPIDCLFIDSEEATQEQLKFINRVKQAISKIRQDNEDHLIKSGDESLGTLTKTEDDNIAVEALFPNITSEETLRLPILNIPDKFKHVHLNRLSLEQSNVEDLKSVLKHVHPWSSLHYGYSAIDTICRLYTQTIPKKLGAQCEIQILTPQVRGSLGTINLNRTIQQLVNPKELHQVQVKMGDKCLRVSDRVIQTRNNYDLEIFNGDIGRISYIDPTDYTCSVEYGKNGKIVKYKKEDLLDLSLAYAITIHKSQGSEFEAVILPTSTQHFKMLFRNLMYTGVTRAKKLAVFVGSRRALALAVNNVDNRKRQTGLKHLLTPS